MLKQQQVFISFFEKTTSNGGIQWSGEISSLLGEKERGDKVAAKVWENRYRTTMICVDSYIKSVPVGRFYNQYYPDGVEFHGAIDLIKKMDALLDQMNMPQSFSAIRSFAEKPAIDLFERKQDVAYTGKTATFHVKVLFRQNTSWQGSISWLEGKREETFRSVLELLLLIDSAINGDSS